jgi:hypothetical protein
MKKKIQKQIDTVLSKIENVTRHIKNVENNCLLLGTKLIKSGNIELGKQLIANGFVHDASKFTGIEFEYLSLNNPAEENNKLKIRLAIQQHNTTNPHHPEFWNHISKMPEVFLAECVCDWKSRSQEFGTDLREWIDNEATKRFHFSKSDAVYKQIMELVDLLCEQPFEQIK